MSGRVIPFYLSRNCQLTKVDVIICHVRYSSRFNCFLSFAENQRMYCYAWTHGTNTWKFIKLLTEPLHHRYFYALFRSSRSQTFFKICAFKNFANFTGKHLHWSLFLRTLQAFRFLVRLQTPCKPSSSFY